MELSQVHVKSHASLDETYRRSFPGVASFVRRMNGSFEDARDIFHDAMIIYIDRRDKVQVSEEAYILGVAKNLWYAKFEREAKQMSSRFSGESEQLTSAAAVNTGKLLEVISRSGQKCLELLHAFYYRKDALRKITADLGYRNEHSASVQKFKCITKLRTFIKSKSLTYEDFVD
jgi:DNA-directed RNA polymerase specialized sigma24 family protein